MSEQDSKLKSTSSSIIVGILFGILMAGLILFSIQGSDYKLYSLSFWIILLMSCVFPSCFDFFSKRGFSLWIVEPLMIGISFIIVLLYAGAVGVNETTKSLLTTLAITYHSASMVVTLIHLYLLSKKGL